MLRKILVISYQLSVISWMSVSAETLKIVDFNYKAKHLRDPFISPLVSMELGTSELAAKQWKQADLEKQFDPAGLTLKAILTDAKTTNPMAILNNPRNPQENYLIQGLTIKHLLSGLSVKNFKPEVKKDQVTLKKISGIPLVIVLKLEGKNAQ